MRAANCCREIGRIGTTKDTDGCLLLGKMQTSKIPGLSSTHDPGRTYYPDPASALFDERTRRLFGDASYDSAL